MKETLYLALIIVVIWFLIAYFAPELVDVQYKCDCNMMQWLMMMAAGVVAVISGQYIFDYMKKSDMLV